MEQLSNYSCKSNRERKTNELLSASFQGDKILFVLVYFVAAGANADEEAGIKDNKNIFFQKERLIIIMY